MLKIRIQIFLEYALIISSVCWEGFDVRCIRKLMWHIAATIVAAALLLSCTGCLAEKPTIVATWVDADGSIIATQSVSSDYDPSTRALPEDDNHWHYTGWQVTRSGDVVVCSANRVAKRHLVWKDYDGTILNELYITENEEPPSFDLPQDDEKWQYTSWNHVGSNNELTYEAERQPNNDYFIGNVFQIVIKDQHGEILGSGSGFVVNKDGWFVTNNHVMDQAYSAVAFFDIKDSVAGQQYTQLNILGGVYNNAEKDIFIGKLDNYRKISQHYHDIAFTEEYTQGDASYSVGYPNSSVKLQINSGVILEEYSDIYNKVDGVYYVLSDSYIAPGSSGGILVNENFEVIGITSIGFYADTSNEYYTSGGSIPYFLFKNALTHLSDQSIIPICDIYKTSQ